MWLQRDNCITYKQLVVCERFTAEVFDEMIFGKTTNGNLKFHQDINSSQKWKLDKRIPGKV